jgi:hypothetical protein
MTEETATTKETTALMRPSREIADAIRDYKRLQEELDKALPDCMVTIQGSKFRKKNYWRAVATAFSLSLDLVEERSELDALGTLAAWHVVYRATAPNGRTAIGDGSCSYMEKVVYRSKGRGRSRVYERDTDGRRLVDEEKTQEAASSHNIRGHAHTRAANRAISNLVGFGEVSADELPRDGEEPPEPPPPQEPPRQSQNEWTAEQQTKVRDLKQHLAIGWDALTMKVLQRTIRNSRGEVPTRDEATQLIAWMKQEIDDRAEPPQGGDGDMP